ncbi:uncharacterized protein [Apostichopus japonicus]|uniref:uncharacterized protein n=1 Tax=Stichopus japonicus TaxID=307972 RepID=UPI003AB16B3C
MERLKLQKEMEKTKVLLEVVDESGEDESDEEEDKGSTSFVLDEIPEDGPNDGVTRFLDTMPRPTSVVKEEHQYTLRELVNSFRLPPIRVEQFKGDPLKYPMWISTFDNLIASRANTAAEKLNLLSQHLEGEPLTMISGYLLMQDSVAYDKARKKLHYWYGGDAVISRAFLGKLENWPKINGRDSAGLKRLSNFLDEICAAKGSIHDLGILDYPQENYKIIAKLPLYIESKWRTVIMKYNNNEGHFPSFEVFAKFIAERAEEANIPTFDCHANETVSYQYQRSSNKKSCATIQPKPISCDLCQGDHESVVCEQFQQATLDHRVKWVQKWGLCFGCLKSGHRSKFCKNRLKCTKCQKRHPTELHRDDLPGVTREVSQSKEVASACGTNDGLCTMAIIPVVVKSLKNGQALQTYAFLDPGSSISFCTDQLRQQLGVGGRRARIPIETMAAPYTLETSIVSNLAISNLDGGRDIKLPNVYTKECLPVTREHIPTQTDVDAWDHLRGKVSLRQINADIGLMIGNAVADAYTPLEMITGPHGSPFAQRSLLGWIPWSIVRPGSSLNTHTVNRVEARAVEDHYQLTQLVQQATKVDFPESQGTERLGMSVADKKFVKIIEDGIELVGGRYVIPLPWVDPNSILPNNKGQARKRFEMLERRFRRDPELKIKYVEFMNKMYDRGYMEQVSETSYEGREWYLPHHPVISNKKPGKVRVVFDCAAKQAGVSLNDLLLQGPDITNSLVGVLLRYREEKVAVMADIEGMFLQVVVPPEDRDALRFLWRSNEEEELKIYRMTRHLFGAISSSAIANRALQRTGEDHGHKYSPDVRKAIRDSFYVDDCLATASDSSKAMALAKGLTDLCVQGGFRLTKWMSNSKEVLASIPSDDRAPELKSLDLNQQGIPISRALGVQWSPQTDMLKFEVTPVKRDHTRRGLLSVVCSLFDPLGFVAPFVLPVKMLLQDICRKGLGWDEPIDDASLQIWQRWLCELERLKEWGVQRCVKSDLFAEVVDRQLHVFSDASDTGYGMCAYLRQKDKEGNLQVSLIFARSRVAPLKYTSIPRLELTAATMAARLTSMILFELDVKEVFYWSDSQTVLKYISNDTRRFKAFVANRVSVILDLTNINQWHYVNTHDNPADEASRGQRIDDFLSNKRWTNGPDFLYRSSEEWYTPQDHIASIDDDPELKRVCNVVVERNHACFVDDLIDRCSSYSKLKRVVGTVIKFTKKVRARCRSESVCCHLTVDNLKAAETLILSHEQNRHFEAELKALTSGSEKEINSVMRKSPLRTLDPMLRGGLIVVGGRLRRADLPEETKHQIVIPKSSPVARLIVLETHKSLGHMGKSAILVRLWKKYWVVGAGTIIRSIVGKCTICRKYQAKRGEQKMAALPIERVTSDRPPFDHTGIDMFGPFEIKRGRSIVKRYGLILTCLATRAIHLEILHSADSDSCLNALRRFLCRRGSISSIRSDNGTNFVGTERTLREALKAWNKSDIPDWLAQRGITWEFNPPAASHFGGIWEAMIRVVRKVMNGILKEQTMRLDDEGLATLMCEIENVVNERPLTTVSTHPEDIKPLTPNMLLTMRSCALMPPGVFDRKDVYVRRRWRQVQYLADLFWARWRKEYLPLLQKRQKWFSPKRNIQKGDVVSVVDESLPRNSWLLGRVLETKVDSKGHVRSCCIKTQHSTLERPIHKLCLLLECEGKSNYPFSHQFS